MANSLTALTVAHDVSDFDCGNPELNKFIQEFAKQGMAKGSSKTFVEERPDNPAKFHGFYALSIRKMIPKGDLPVEISKKLPREVSAITLARLAVDSKAQGQGIGERLLFDAMKRALEAASRVGGWALFVDAKDENAAAFYRKYGFISFPSNPLILFMTFATMAQLFE